MDNHNDTYYLYGMHPVIDARLLAVLLGKRLRFLYRSLLRIRAGVPQLL